MTKLVRLIAIVAMLGIFAVTIAASQRDSSWLRYDSEVATAWFDLQLQLIQGTPGFTPPVAARALGYAGVTLYEAVVPGMPEYISLAGQLNELAPLPQPAAGAEYHWPAVANSAMAAITRYMFPNASAENQAAIDALYEEFAEAYRATINPVVLANSETQGRIVADAIYIWSLTDGGHEGYKHNFPADYVTPEGPGMWQPTPRVDGDPQPALQPYWGNNRPFVLTSGEECAAPAPPAYSEDTASVFYEETLEVYEVVANLTDEQMEIALFWADDPGQTPTPPGHSISITTQILREGGYDLDVAAEAYARVGMAVADAFIGCWSTKYVYNLVRPITVIREWFDADWMSPVGTPPFPEYPSGHSVQSGATARVLTDLFGDNYAFTDHAHAERGFAARSFTSFNDFAQEAAISRLYGGIHFRAAIELGVDHGECIGARISAVTFRQPSA